MASRKAKPREKKRVPEDRPSRSMTIEVEALTVDALIDAARGGSRPPPPPTTSRALEETDLAATVEIAAIGSAGPRLLIMDAAEAVIADRGFNLATTREVASFAGVSVDVFHGHFADMRSLLVALCERLCAQATSLIDEATRPDAEAPVEHAIGGVVDLMLGRAALVRAVFALGERGLIDEIRRVGTYLTVRLSRVLDAPEPQDIGFAVLLAVSIAHHTIVVGPEWAGVELDRDRISRRAAQAASAYIASTRRSP